MGNCGRSLEIDLNWQWDNMPDLMLDCLSALGPNSTTEQKAFDDIRARQIQSPPVYNAYKQCHDSDPVGWWEGVTTAALRATWDQGGIIINTDWQWTHNNDSFKKAQDANTSGATFGRAYGMYWMMWGQRHDTAVMKAYRAASRDNPEWWWQKINSYR